MSIFDTIITQITSIHELFLDHTSKLTGFSSTVNLNLIQNVKDYQHGVKEKLIKIQKFIHVWNSDDIKTLKFADYSMLIFKLFGSIINIHNSMDKIYQILSNQLNIDMESGISTTCSIDIVNSFENINILYNIYVSSTDKSVIKLIDMFSTSIFNYLTVDENLTNTPPDYKILQDYYRNNDDTIQLYIKIMQQIIDYSYKHNLSNKHFPEAQIEQDKTWQLTHGTKYSHFKEKRFHGSKFGDTLSTNCLVSRWNLSPHTAFVSLSKIIDVLFNISINIKHPYKWQSIVKTISKLTKTSLNLIVMTKSTPIVITHNLDNIIGSVSSQYLVIGDEGVSNRHIKKFNTLTCTKNKWNININLYTNILSKDIMQWDKYFIIETFDNINFRILSRYTTSNQLDKHHIAGLISYLEYKKRIVQSRVTEYNKTLEIALYTNLIKSTQLDLDEIAIESAYKIDTGPLKQQIISKLMKIINSLITKHKPSSLAELRDILYTQELEVALVSILIDIFQSNDIFKLEQNDFDQKDILDSFLYNIKESSKTFNKEFTQAFSAIVLSDKSIIKSNYSFTIKSALTSALNVIMTRENNVFQNVTFKIDMLTNL